MIRRIVLWRLGSDTEDDKRRDAVRIKEALEAMRGEIPGLIGVTVGINSADSEDAADVMMQADFTSWEAMDTYDSHPKHEVAKRIVGPLRTERRVVEFEI